MKNKNYTLFLVVIGFLVIVSIGLTAFNFIVLNNETVETKYYYRAIKDIPSYSQLSTDMFEKVPVPDTFIMEGMVVEDTKYIGKEPTIKDVIGKYNNTAIGKGEYLVYDYVTTDNSEKDLYYTIEIVGTYVADVAYDDNVDIWLLAQDNSINQLFSMKKIYRPKTTAITDANTTETNKNSVTYEAASKLYIRVTENEMKQYYSSLRDNRIIIVPYNENYDSSKEPSIKIEQTGDEDITVVPNTFDYVARDGETFESLASDFNTDPDLLKALNPNVSIIVKGTEIKIPVN